MRASSVPYARQFHWFPLLRGGIHDGGRNGPLGRIDVAPAAAVVDLAGHELQPAVPLQHVKVAIEDGEVVVVRAVRLLDPSDHALVVAKLGARDQRHDGQLVAQVAQHLRGLRHEVPVLLRPLVHLVLKGDAVRRLVDGNESAEGGGVGQRPVDDLQFHGDADGFGPGRQDPQCPPVAAGRGLLRHAHGDPHRLNGGGVRGRCVIQRDERRRIVALAVGKPGIAHPDVRRWNHPGALEFLRLGLQPRQRRVGPGHHQPGIVAVAGTDEPDRSQRFVGVAVLRCAEGAVHVLVPQVEALAPGDVGFDGPGRGVGRQAQAGHPDERPLGAGSLGRLVKIQGLRPVSRRVDLDRQEVDALAQALQRQGDGLDLPRLAQSQPAGEVLLAGCDARLRMVWVGEELALSVNVGLLGIRRGKHVGPEFPRRQIPLQDLAAIEIDDDSARVLHGEAKLLDRGWVLNRELASQTDKPVAVKGPITDVALQAIKERTRGARPVRVVEAGLHPIGRRWRRFGDVAHLLSFRRMYSPRPARLRRRDQVGLPPGRLAISLDRGRTDKVRRDDCRAAGRERSPVAPGFQHGLPALGVRGAVALALTG